MQNSTSALNWDVSETSTQESLTSEAERIVLTIITTIITVVCVTGNVFVLIVLVRNENLRVVTNGFIAVIATCDLLIAVLSMPLGIISLIQTKWIFGSVICQLSSFTTGTGTILATMTITFLTVDRHLSFDNSTRKRTTPRLAACFIGFSFLVAVLASVPWYVFATNTGDCIHHKSDLVFQQCVYQPVCEGTPSWTVFLIVRLFMCCILPFIVMVICSICICKTLHRSRIETAPVIINANDIRFSAEVKTAVTVVIIFCIHSLCSIPFYINEALVHTSRDTLINTKVDYILILLLWINKVVNPIVYIVRNPYFSKYFCFKRRHRYVDEATSPKDPRISYLVGSRGVSGCCDHGDRWSRPSVSILFTQRYSIDSENGEITDTTTA